MISMLPEATPSNPLLNGKIPSTNQKLRAKNVCLVFLSPKIKLTLKIDNPLNEGGFKKPNVSDEALDSVYPGPKYSPTMKSDNASNGMQPGDKKATKK